MDVKEKLVELFYDNNVRCDQKIEGLAEDVMDIIAHGVTVADGKDTDVPTEIYAQAKSGELLTNCQQWIPASEPPKDEDQRVLVWLSRSPYHQVRVDTDRFLDGKWVRWGKCVTHWTPICMPEPSEPPKEE